MGLALVKLSYRIGRSLLVAGILILVFLVPYLLFMLQNLSPYANVAGAYSLFYTILIIGILLLAIGSYLMVRFKD
jgi:uncharacterized membrane protein YozB (DUF420 family)